MRRSSRGKNRKKNIPWDNLDAMVTFLYNNVPLVCKNNPIEKKILKTYIPVRVSDKGSTWQWISTERKVITFAVFEDRTTSESHAYDLIWPECQIVFIGSSERDVGRGHAPELTKLLLKKFKVTKEYHLIPEDLRIENGKIDS